MFTRNPSTKGGCVAPNGTLLLPDFANDVNGNVIDKGFAGGDSSCNGSPVYTYLNYLNIKAGQVNYSNHANKGERLLSVRRKTKENTSCLVVPTSHLDHFYMCFPILPLFKYLFCSIILRGGVEGKGTRTALGLLWPSTFISYESAWTVSRDTSCRFQKSDKTSDPREVRYCVNILLTLFRYWSAVVLK